MVSFGMQKRYTKECTSDKFRLYIYSKCTATDVFLLIYIQRTMTFSSLALTGFREKLKYMKFVMKRLTGELFSFSLSFFFFQIYKFLVELTFTLFKQFVSYKSIMTSQFPSGFTIFYISHTYTNHDYHLIYRRYIYLSHVYYENSCRRKLLFLNRFRGVGWMGEISFWHRKLISYLIMYVKIVFRVM